MSSATKDLRDAFQPRTALVRTHPEGFLVGDDLRPTLEGTIDRITLRRKRFEGTRLVCHSEDGVRAVDETACDMCQHTRCRPHLRIGLVNKGTRYIVDLTPSSAHNLFALEDDILTSGGTLMTTRLYLETIDRGDWGEVTFERL
jgi:hypothetical protein